MRKVLYLSLKEFRSAQKRQLEDGTPNSNGKLVPVTVTFICSASSSKLEAGRWSVCTSTSG